MTLGVQGSSVTDDDFRFAVLHEFGHTLGLVHETQNPNADIAWNRDAVIREYRGAPNRWSREQIDNQFFETGTIPRASYRAFDPLSVMWYPLPDKLFAKPIVQRNAPELSASDKAFAAVLYPAATALATPR